MSDITYIYGKNAIIEALEVQERTFNKILIADNLHKDEKIEQIILTDPSLSPITKGNYHARP